MKKLTTFLAVATIIVCSCSAPEYYHIEDGRIVLSGVPQYYLGTNLWYAADLAVSDPGRLVAELDSLKSLGLWNLRIKATDENFEGLDFTLKEMSKRGMAAVLYLNNAWEWTPDGYRSYLEEATGIAQPHPAKDGYKAYTDAMSEFAACEKAQELFRKHIAKVVTRYRNEPSIFSWQICNEPRPFSTDPVKTEAFVEYIQSTAAYIKSLDHNHMVSTGNEGWMGCGDSDKGLFMKVHNCPDIDYLTIHIWPYNWSWVKADDISGGVQTAIEKTGEYIENHLNKAYRLKKPAVIEEFGYPRDGFEYVNTSATSGRDRLYGYVFDRVIASAKNGGSLAGCNFWGWSGLAKQTPGHQFWQEGDDLCGDPSQEAQGLNGVYISDTSTIDVIRSSVKRLDKIISVFAPNSESWLQTGDGPFKLKIAVSSSKKADFELGVYIVTDLSLMASVKDTVFSHSTTVEIENGLEYVCMDVPLKPGFYQVNTQIGKPHKGVMEYYPAGSFNIGYKPEEICSPQDKEADFDAFWEKTLAELASVPLEVNMTEEPEHSNELRKCYTVTFKSLGGELAGGRLCVPTSGGRHRTFIDYMGYGSDPYWYDPSAAPEDVEFLVSVRDQGIFKRPGHDRWIDRRLDSKEAFYYRGAFCDVVRAIDFICSLDCVDQDKLFARGESQGGAFTWISASLDHRVDAIAPAVPFLSDYEDYGKIVWWPVWEVYKQAEDDGISREELHKMLSYFDIKNFTDRVECPVFMAFGLQDPTCPPHTNFAGYNQVKSAKSYLCVPTCGHGMWQESSWSKQRKEFFDSK